MTIIAELQTGIKRSAEENTALKKSITEVSDNFQDIVTRVNETGKTVSGKVSNQTGLHSKQCLKFAVQSLFVMLFYHPQRNYK